jgi:hypothetical protein
MRSQKGRALSRVLAFAALLGALILGMPDPAQACAGGGDFYDCKSFWLDELFYPCLELNCVGLPPGGQPGQYGHCRRECWQQYLDVSRGDCSNCPI